MVNDQIILLKDRGLILINGKDSKNFLQNIITNDIEKVSNSNTIFSALFTPQGKYLYEFFILKSKNGFLLDCDNKLTSELIGYLSKYKLRSKVEISDISEENIIGLISAEKFFDIQKSENKVGNTIEYRDSSIFIDPRSNKLGARILSPLEKLHLTVKKLNLKITEPFAYYEKAYSLGIPIKGVENLKDQLFGLEANFEELQAIDFKKGCYIGQENTARMKLKNKIRRKLLAIQAQGEVKIGDEITYENIKVGKILINKPHPFALIKLFDPDFSVFKNDELECGNLKVKIMKNLY